MLAFVCMHAALTAQSKITSPAPGSVLTGSTATFSWSATTGANGYSLWLGSTGVGSNNLYHCAESKATSITVPGLPTNGETIYAQLNTYTNGTMQHLNYTYTAFTSSTSAALTSPAPASTLPGPTVTFDWSAGTSASGYSLWLGSTGVGSNNLYHSAESTATSLTVSGLPTNGETIYARLNSLINGALQHVDYTYTASNSLPAMSALTCNSIILTGAGTDSCKVTLNGAAPSAGLSVSLSSSNAAVTVPATVTIPANATSAGFTATVTPVATAQSVTLTASTGSTTQTIVLLLNASVPTLAVTTSNPSTTYGGGVTFTATISSGPTGSVTFYDGATPIGAAAINGATAAFSTSSLTAGVHVITANWPGNSNYAPVTSVAITQVVNKATPSVTWATPAAIVSGTALSATQLDATASVPGTFAYSPASGTVPATGSQILTVIFTPTDTTDYNTATDSVTLTVNAATPTLSINATTVAFGNVDLNTPATQTVILTSTGTGSVTVNSATLTGTGFTLSGPTFPETLATGQTATLGIEFDPTVTGAASGTLTVVSTSSTNPTATVSVTGTGIATAYVVNLSWNAPTDSTDPVAGYNIYRSPSGSSSYTLLNSTVDALTTYADSTVQDGNSYDYIVESVDASGVESVPTSPVAVTIP
jgi:hypothetical protein